MRVSGGVQRGVSLETAGGGARERPPSRGPGPHLVRCGTSYLFQIRLPIALGGGRAVPPIRIGIGARPASDARRIADLLAAAARTEFDRVGSRRMSNEENEAEPPDEPTFPGDDPMVVLMEMRGYLKGVLSVIKKQGPEPYPHQMPGLAGLKGLAGIAREIEKGPEGNPLVVDNAGLLKASTSIWSRGRH